MRTRIDSIDLVGTSRSVAFTPGLNIITGPIASGKSTLLRMCHALLGASIEDYPPEARANVTALAGRLVLGDADYTTIRPFVTTRTAKVDVSSANAALRLPALQLDASANYTYAQWLLRTIGLPEVRVPSAPTRSDSDTTAVSINDYLLYCVLPQETIDNSVFGHRDAFRNIKRKYVFEILYGLYDVNVYRCQEELHGLLARLGSMHNRAASFEHLLAGTPWENRATLTAALTLAKQQLQTADEAIGRHAQGAPSSPTAQTLRRELLALDDQIGRVQADEARELTSIDELHALLRQLESQSKRLTRAIVAKRYLTDFEFVLCPRCGTGIPSTRLDDAENCVLCLQPPTHTLDRTAFISEQDRISAQIDETRELIAIRKKGSTTLRSVLEELLGKRAELGRALDLEMRSFVSDSAAAIAEQASARPQLTADIARLEDYLRLFSKLDDTSKEIEQLSRRQVELEGELEQLKTRRNESESRIQRLEELFELALARIGIPRFSETPSSRIDRATFLPVVDGRRFDELSSQGLQVLVNVAHAVAHQTTAIELGLPLPGILIIDGLTSNVGQEGYDLDRVHSAYQFLMSVGGEFGNEVQIIVADGNVPPEAEEFVRLRLSETDRLIPVGSNDEHQAPDPLGRSS